MGEEMFMDGKSWGIKDAIEKLEQEVESLELMVVMHKSQLELFQDKRNSLDIGLYILKKLYEKQLVHGSALPSSEETAEVEP